MPFKGYFRLKKEGERARLNVKTALSVFSPVLLFPTDRDIIPVRTGQDYPHPYTHLWKNFLLPSVACHAVILIPSRVYCRDLFSDRLVRARIS